MRSLALPAFAVLALAAGAAASQTLTPEQVRALMDPEVEAHLKTITEAAPEARVVQTLRGRLAPAAVQRFQVESEGGDFEFVAVCDEACGDLDLRMLAPNGEAVFEDVGPTRFPAIRAAVEGKVVFQVELIMKACAKETCAWGVRILKQPAPAA